MKTAFTLLTFLCLQTMSFGQCSSVSAQISSSDTNQVQLYHAGFFNIDSGYANVCDWEVTTLAGAVIHQATTSGQWADQSFSLFNHSVPISDSMEVTLFITNPISGITCSITDTIFWEETEVLPGSFIGNWAILGEYGGEENELITSINSVQISSEFQIIPSMVFDQFVIKNLDETHSVVLFDSMGKKVLVQSVNVHQAINISSFESGIYYVQIYKDTDKVIGFERLMKL